MKKVIGIILIIVGGFGLIGLLINIETVTANRGIAYLLGRLSPILFLIIGFLLIRKKNT